MKIKPSRIKSCRKILRVPTKVGVFILEQTPQGLFSVQFPKKGKTFPKAKRGKCLLSRFFSQKLDLSGCTAFEKKVYAALRKVPAGKTMTYGALARKAGFPGAARAVGTAMRKNRLPIVIPCHRVIRSGGDLGQYSAGVKWKRFLLQLEGDLSSNPR